MAILVERKRGLVANTAAALGISHRTGGLMLMELELVVLYLSEHILDLLLDGCGIELACLHNMRKLSLDVQLIVLFDDVRVESRDGDLVLPHEHHTVMRALWMAHTRTFVVRRLLSLHLGRDRARDLTLVVHSCLRSVQLVFDVAEHASMPLDNTDQFAHFLVLLLQVISQRLVVLK